MKTERLMGIVAVLIKRKSISTGELSRLFEVSRRTIIRDLESLSMAGIPIVTTQGYGGGVGIAEGFALDKALLSQKETEMMLTALRSLYSVTDDESYALVMEKLKKGSSSYLSGSGHMLIDLKSWGGEEIVRKISLVEKAISNNRCVSFSYCSPKGEGERVVEPYFLVYRWSSWYLWGWCRSRLDYRLFKLSRMSGLEKGEVFQPKQSPYPDLNDEMIFTQKERFKALFAPKVKWRVMENLRKEDLEILPDGSVLASSYFGDEEGLINWLLTFGSDVMVLESVSLREKIKMRAEEILSLYKDGV